MFSATLKIVEKISLQTIVHHNEQNAILRLMSSTIKRKLILHKTVLRSHMQVWQLGTEQKTCIKVFLCR